MELPQPRSFKTQGGYLETHDFLRPLERGGKNASKEGNKIEEQLIAKPASLASPTGVEHILPGGIGSYSTSHISRVNQSRKMSRHELAEFTAAQTQCTGGSDKNDDSSNGSSYKGSGFSLWEESGVKKGKTRKENIAGNKHGIIEGAMHIGGVPWMTSMDRSSPSSSTHNHPSTTISSLSSSYPPSAPKNPSFVDMLKSAKYTRPEDDDDEEEIVIKKEPSLHYKDTIHLDQKPNTSRSKHSATEQRRRSKINDRFCMLREVIPHGDQKRDKASFLLEVIEYIQFLQEKVHKYEDSWNKESPVTLPWVNSSLHL